jgi:hypothetical protein
MRKIYGAGGEGRGFVRRFRNEMNAQSARLAGPRPDPWSGSQSEQREADLTP